MGTELGLDIVSYEYFTVIREVTGFIGLSSNEKDDDIAPANSVNPPLAPVVLSQFNGPPP